MAAVAVSHAVARRAVAMILAALLAMVTLSVGATPASADTTTVGSYVYSYDAGNVAAGATITDYVGSATVLAIPGSVTIGPNTYDVTTIGNLAFFANSLTSVTIPNSVTTISEGALAFNQLTSVTIPGSVTTIGDGAFKWNALTSVTIPDSVTTIGEDAFYANVLTSVTIGDSVTTIGKGAFGSNALTSVAIGGSVTTIGDYAFDTNALTSVTIPNSVTTIGHSAFFDNDLTAVTIGGSVATIGDYAFLGNALTSVTIGGSVTSIGDSAFAFNPLVSVLMQGPVPSSIGDMPFGPAGATTPLVSFHYLFSSSGYTTPTWYAGGQAYRSQERGYFTDVPTSSPFFEDIEWMADAGISTGYPDGTFRPAENVSRQAMAAFMYRFAGSPVFTPPVTSPFNDVPTDSPFYPEICWMAAQGISTGYDDGGFRPAANVSRQAMAAFMYRLAGSPAFTPPVTSPFNDVAPSSTFYKEITWMASTGITTGYADGGFHPTANVSRQAMAAFLHRLDGVLNPV